MSQAALQKIVEEQMKVNHFITEIKDGVLTITMNRPKISNAFDLSMYIRFGQILDDAAKNDKVKVLLLKGNGRNFSTGNDLSGIMQDFSGGEVESIQYQYQFQKQWSVFFADILRTFVNKILDFPKPMIALVQGNTIGFFFTGLGLFDYVLITEDAKFKAPMVKSSQNIEMCASYTFPRVFGPGKAFELLVLARELTAREALHFGFAQRAFKNVEDLHKHGEEVAREVASMNSKCVDDAKRLMRETYNKQLKEANHRECLELTRAWGAEDFPMKAMQYLLDLKQQRPKL